MIRIWNNFVYYKYDKDEELIINKLAINREKVEEGNPQEEIHD